MHFLSQNVSDDELIVRGICTPYHLNKSGKLLPGAYRSPKGKDEVSVIRHDCVGTDFCKVKAKQLSNPGKGKIYVGLAVLAAAQIRLKGSEVIDSRDVYPGHADIKHGFVDSIDGEPPPPEQLEKMQDRLKALSALARFFPDPDVTSEKWGGGPLG